MVAPASYGWNHALVAAVADTASVDVPAPDINDDVDETTVSVAVDGDLLGDEDFDFVFDIPGKKVTVINTSGEEWEEQSNLYVSAQRAPLTGENIGGDTSALEARIVTLEGQVANHETRIAALEAAGAPVARSQRK